MRQIRRRYRRPSFLELPDRLHLAQKNHSRFLPWRGVDSLLPNPSEPLDTIVKSDGDVDVHPSGQQSITRLGNFDAACVVRTKCFGLGGGVGGSDEFEQAVQLTSRQPWLRRKGGNPTAS